MQFEQEHVYHIYNQGNNRQRIFFDRENYVFFLKKIKEFVSPHADIIAWCLMPNHFHLMVEVRTSLLEIERATQSRPLNQDFTQLKSTTLNKSIGIMLASYTRAINQQHNRTGSLFRSKTKAECITKIEAVSPSFVNGRHGVIIKTHHPEMAYPQVCFDYIHQNPVRAGLVTKAEEWEFSSYRDYCGIRNGGLIHRECRVKYGIST